MSTETPTDTAESLGPLLGSIQELVRNELSKARTDGASDSTGGLTPENIRPWLLENAAALFESAEWKQHVNARIEEAFQKVLPQMIKRFRADMDERLSSSGSGDNGGGGNLRAMINSPEMKEALEDRFRTMLLYLKQDVIPKAIKASQSG